MKARLHTLAAALVLASAASAANAALVTTTCPDASATAGRQFSITPLPGAACLASGDGNIGNGSNDLFLAGRTGYTLIESDERNNSTGALFLTGIGAASGTFQIDSSLYSRYADLALGFKSGANVSPEYAVFSLTSGITTGAWMISRNSLSHAVLYGHVGTPTTPTTPPSANVPAPGMLALVGIGLVGLGGSLRSRQGATRKA